MADSINFGMVTKPFTEFLDRQRTSMRRAAMFSLRETGRVVAREAKTRAPVLSDSSVVTAAQVRRDTKFAKGGGIGPVRGTDSGPVKGLLKASIKPSKHLTPAGLDSWTLKVGPRGPRVFLYSGKIEALHPYMAPARDAAEAQSLAIAAQVFTRVWKS